jgi:hypothetical protein
MLHRWRFPAVWAAEAGGRTTVASAPEHPSHAGLASAREVAPYTGTKLRMFPQFRCTCAPVTSLPGEHHHLQDVKERARDPMQNSAPPPRPYKGGICRSANLRAHKKRAAIRLDGCPLSSVRDVTAPRVAALSAHRRLSEVAGCSCLLANLLCSCRRCFGRAASNPTQLSAGTCRAGRRPRP